MKADQLVEPESERRGILTQIKRSVRRSEKDGARSGESAWLGKKREPIAE